MVKFNGIFEPTARHIRVKFGGEIVADSRNVMLMIESAYEMNYYFPEKDVRMDLLKQSDQSENSGYKGKSIHWHVNVGGKIAENAAWSFVEDKEKRPDLRGMIAFQWDVMDSWHEEDEQVFGHARSPYHRVDTIQSSRNIRVELDGVTVAESKRPMLLFETGLPTRYYIPLEDIIQDYLKPSDSQTICPYKGFASYWSLQVNGQSHQDLAWYYSEPYPESAKIGGLVSFYNEKLDIYVDGELEQKAKTVWS